MSLKGQYRSDVEARLRVDFLPVCANWAAADDRKAARFRRCGARRKRDGQPCIAKVLKNGRCKFHGERSTRTQDHCRTSTALVNLRGTGRSLRRDFVEPHDGRAR